MTLFALAFRIDRVFGLHAKLRSVFGLAEVDQMAEWVTTMEIMAMTRFVLTVFKSASTARKPIVGDLMMEQQPAQVIAHHKHDDDADETDGGQCCVFEALHGSILFNAAGKRDIQHKFIKSLPLIVIKITEFSTNIP